MKKYFLFTIILSTFISLANCQTPAPNRQQTEREQEIAKIDYELQTAAVIEKLRIINLAISRSIKSKTFLSPLKYSSYSHTLKNWTNYRWFIADTGLSRKWLKGVAELVQYMCKMQVYLSAEKFNGRTGTAKYKQAENYFNVAYKRFLAAIKKPAKVSGKLQRKAKLQKALWQKAMRKKYKVKKGETDFL